MITKILLLFTLLLLLGVIAYGACYAARAISGKDDVPPSEDKVEE